MRERNHWYEQLIGRQEELEDDDAPESMDEVAVARAKKAALEREADRAALQDAQRLRIRNVHDLRRYC